MPRLAAAAAIALAAFAAVALTHTTGALARLELLTHDARILSGVGRKAPRDDIVVAWIDQDTRNPAATTALLLLTVGLAVSHWLVR